MRTKLTSRIEQAMARLEGNDPDLSKSTLLIVDDEKGPRESLRMILSPQHRVLVAHDGGEALAILAEQDVDAITVDLNMPGIKGDALVRRISKEYPQVEIVIITGYSSVATAVDGLRHGIFDYLTKPFDVVQVSNTLRRALARRESRRRLIGFLGAIGQVLGHDRDIDSALDELASSPELQTRLRNEMEQPTDPTTRDLVRPPAARTREFLESLSSAVERREPYRVGHARRVAFLAGLIGERVGLTAERREELRLASFLHDVGRVALAPRVADEADADEATELHATTGAYLSRALGYSPGVAEAIQHHHEHFDGSGSPAGLAGNEIPLASRIIALSDAFDRLTHDEPGAEARSPAEAIVALRGQGGSELDPDLLKDLIVIAESGASSSGPLLGLHFQGSEDPADTIASATAWLEADR